MRSPLTRAQALSLVVTLQTALSGYCMHTQYMVGFCALRPTKRTSMPAARICASSASPRAVGADHADGVDLNFRRQYAGDVVQNDVLLAVVPRRAEARKARFIAAERTVPVQLEEYARADAARADDTIKARRLHRSHP